MLTDQSERAAYLHVSAPAVVGPESIIPSYSTPNEYEVIHSKDSRIIRVGRVRLP